MSTTREPEHRFPLAQAVYRSLRGGHVDATAGTRPATVLVRAAAALGSGTITFAEAVDRIGEAGLPDTVVRTGDASPAPTLDQITATRLVLEPAAAVRASAAVTPNDRELLLRRASFLGSAVGIEPDPRRLFRHDCDVHGMLYRLATGDVAHPALAGLCTLAHRRWASHARSADDVLSVVRPHLTELGHGLRAVAAGDCENARALSTAHAWGAHLMLMQAGADLPR